MRSTRTMLAALAVSLFVGCTQSEDVRRWEARAANVTITRDDWGIAHVHGPTDADAVFGMIYAQAEDDFNRIETNYLNAMGRLAEAEGEAEIWRDLRMKLFINPDSLQAMYARSPAWLQSLMDAWANGLNYYLHTHPEVTPRVITRFEPWMALSFSEGSIGGDIERVNLAALERFYSAPPAVTASTASRRIELASGLVVPDDDEEPRGSNGIAIAPSNTTAGRALLLINPHTSFYFRSELQMTSDEGLNAYGAVTWGQFFIYQGFNERAGWMHTSSGVDNIDEYVETITQKDDGYYYRHGAEERRVWTSEIVVPFRTDTGMAERRFTTFRTHHGPIVRSADGRWIAVRLMEEPLKALTQSYSRTKATNYATFRETMELHTNSSNNTIFADAEGNIAYFHANFVPRRDPKFDWSRPVDGADPGTDWGAPLGIDETPLVVNPATGWLYNANNWPWSAAGPNSPRRADFPSYVEGGSRESPRGEHALMVLDGPKDFTIDGLIAAAYDSYLPAFAKQVPPLVRAWDRTPASNPLKAQLADQIAELRAWDYRWSAASVATSLGVFWLDAATDQLTTAARSAQMPIDDYIATRATAQELLGALATASDKLAADFGTWRTPWGDINRFQRISPEIAPRFDDAQPSIPVPFTSARYGSLASYGARAYPNTKKWYGTSGNSFVAVVEFGADSVRAKAVTAGGESGDPSSPHFNDQADRYAAGDLRPVYFYPGQLAEHTTRRYRPGR